MQKFFTVMDRLSHDKLYTLESSFHLEVPVINLLNF
jgi:hypothetical protein